jgi:monoterpene epsilon-lactone hydrolase
MTGPAVDASARATRTTREGVDAVVARLQATTSRWGRGTPLAQMRQDWDDLFPAQVDASVTPALVGGVPGTWVAAPGASNSALLFLHGGGFQVGSSRSHRELMAALSAEAGCRVLGLDYRLAPEHRWPAAHDDARAAWDGLIAQGLSPRQIAVVGDSAGGGLALQLLLALRDAGRALPAAAVTLSAWTDLSASGDSHRTQADADPLNQRATLLAMARTALGKDADPRDPSASALFADLHGLPPLLMQVGEREIVRSDSSDFADRARAAGVDVTLQVWPGMVHVFQQFPELAAAREARRDVGRFLRTHLNPQTPKGP